MFCSHINILGNPRASTPHLHLMIRMLRKWLVKEPGPGEHTGPRMRLLTQAVQGSFSWLIKGIYSTPSSHLTWQPLVPRRYQNTALKEPQRNKASHTPILSSRRHSSHSWVFSMPGTGLALCSSMREPDSRRSPGWSSILIIHSRLRTKQ